MKISSSFNFETKGYKGNDSFIKYFGYFFIYVKFKMFNFRCMSHVQEIII